MRYRLEFLNGDGVVVWAQVGTVHESGNWTFNIDTIRRDLAASGHTIVQMTIRWGAEVDRT
jgi:hypothetical protein